jgi:copper resistance protein C
MAMRITAMTLKLSRLLVVLMTLALAWATTDANAHSFPEEQHPSAGQTLAAPPSEIKIKFDAPIEQLFAKLQVLDADGKDHAAGAAKVSADGLELTGKVDAMKPGEYTVKWAVLCVDTHHTEGSFSFTIAGGGT